MMEHAYHFESLSQDPVHGYIAFSSPSYEGSADRFTERDLIDSPWVQRLRQIHQLQTAWWVYPSAEHSRFQHVLGTMFMASRVWQHLRQSFYQVYEKEPGLLEGAKLPSAAYLESLLRIAALLHDVGHGPFGHFFDANFLQEYSLPGGEQLTHESLGGEIIQRELGGMIREIRRNPFGELNANEILLPEQVAFLIVRPRQESLDDASVPHWLKLLRSLFSGLYTVDNMDFVLRDAYMTGFNSRAFDVDRLIHYTFFTPQGLTLHQRGLSTLIRFLSVRAELFRSVYFHRTVRAIDLTLGDLFRSSRHLLFPYGNPLEHLEAYRRLTDWSLISQVSQWLDSSDPNQATLAQDWQAILQRQIPWCLLAEKTLLFHEGDLEVASVFADPRLFEAAVRRLLPPAIRSLDLRFDIARHLHRPDSHRPTADQNYLYEPATQKIVRLEMEDLYRSIPQSYRICRIYGRDFQHQSEIACVLDRLTTHQVQDDPTNM